MRKILCFIGVFVTSSTLWAAQFSRIKTWTDGDTLTAGDLNAEFSNILNNFNPAGMDSYENTLTNMRATNDPYPGSTESQAASFQTELSQIRYQILALKQAIQASNVTYWYQRPPTAGVFTIAGSSVGVNQTSPSYALDVTGTGHISGNVTIDGSLTNAGIFVSGTKMLFYQSTCPSGWTGVGSLSDKFIRVVSTGTTGGTTGGTMAASTNLSHTHTGPAHTHTTPNHQHPLAYSTEGLTNANSTGSLSSLNTLSGDSDGSYLDGGKSGSSAGTVRHITNQTTSSGSGTTGSSGTGVTSVDSVGMGIFAYADIIVCTKD